MTHPCSSLSALSRRDWLRLSAAGVVSYSLSGWLERLAAAAADHPQRKRACILLWMNGGPSQMDTFDLKPGDANGGPFKEIPTSVPGIRISEHLPKLAGHMKHLALVRSMSTKEADHGRATYLLHTGRPPGGPIEYPTLGSFLSRELEDARAALPGFVSIAPFRIFNSAAYSPGFLGPRHAPLIVGEGQNAFNPQAVQQDIASQLRVQDLLPPAHVAADRALERLQVLDALEEDFLTTRATPVSLSHRTAYQRAVTLMRSQAARAFDLDEEKPALRDRYGRSLFGQGCLLARRLVERGVPFVEVTLSTAPGVPNGVGWDTHQQNFETVSKLSSVLDPAWATLMDDLRERGLLESTLVVWMGEFGRKPQIQGGGRDHWATSWTTVLGGGGIRGGQVVGRTSPDGMAVADHPVAVADLLGTVGMALGLDIRKQNDSNVGRPIRLVEPNARPIKEVLA